MSVTEDESKLNELNLELQNRLAAGANGVLITRTELSGKVCLRMAIGGVNHSEKYVREAFECFSVKARELLAEQRLVVSKAIRLPQGSDEMVYKKTSPAVRLRPFHRVVLRIRTLHRLSKAAMKG